jgi:hypothetical protein
MPGEGFLSGFFTPPPIAVDLFDMEVEPPQTPLLPQQVLVEIMTQPSEWSSSYTTPVTDYLNATKLNIDKGIEIDEANPLLVDENGVIAGKSYINSAMEYLSSTFSFWNKKPNESKIFVPSEQSVQKNALGNEPRERSFMTEETSLRVATMSESAAHGALRGTRHLLEQGMKERGYDVNTSENAAMGVYMGLYGLGRFAQHYQNYRSESVEDEATLNAVYHASVSASVETLWLLAVNKGLALFAQGSEKIAGHMQDIGWDKSAEWLNFFAQHSSKLIYGRSIITEGGLDTALNIASGVVAEEAVKYIGERILTPKKSS